MKKMFRFSTALIFMGITILLAPLLLPDKLFAQEEVASAIRRYKEYEVSTGYYEEYEVLPRRQRPFVEIPGVRRGIFPYSPTAANVRVRTRLADSHQGIKFYQRRRCEDCHAKETRDIHTVRANLTCRQCHGGEPVASIAHIYSPLNPIRRHAYVCAKCHEGASASYASYVVHPPNPALVSTMKTFPVLFYVFWIMVFIAVGTFVVFLPHTILWGIRELFVKKEKTDRESASQE
jgi:Cytochrome c3